MDPQHFARRPKKARTWLRTREVERLRLYNLQLDIQALHTEIRTLTVTRALLVARDAPNVSSVANAKPTAVRIEPVRRQTTTTARKRQALARYPDQSTRAGHTSEASRSRRHATVTTTSTPTRYDHYIRIDTLLNPHL